jgi:hypothetical protein
MNGFWIGLLDLLTPSFTISLDPQSIIALPLIYPLQKSLENEFITGAITSKDYEVFLTFLIQ